LREFFLSPVGFDAADLTIEANEMGREILGRALGGEIVPSDA
jgi:hypothetical protein